MKHINAFGSHNLVQNNNVCQVEMLETRLADPSETLFGVLSNKGERKEDSRSNVPIWGQWNFSRRLYFRKRCPSETVFGVYRTENEKKILLGRTYVRFGGNATCPEYYSGKEMCWPKVELTIWGQWNLFRILFRKRDVLACLIPDYGALPLSRIFRVI